MGKYAEKICEIIDSSYGHMTAEQIFEVLKQTYPSVVLATVYNNLNNLAEEGMIRRISIEGMTDRYDRTERHDHLVCRKCGKISDITLEDLTAQLQQQIGVELVSYDLRLIYLCEECKRKK